MAAARLSLAPLCAPRGSELGDAFGCGGGGIGSGGDGGLTDCGGASGADGFHLRFCCVACDVSGGGAAADGATAAASPSGLTDCGGASDVDGCHSSFRCVARDVGGGGAAADGVAAAASSSCRLRSACIVSRIFLMSLTLIDRSKRIARSARSALTPVVDVEQRARESLTTASAAATA